MKLWNEDFMAGWFWGIVCAWVWWFNLKPAIRRAGKKIKGSIKEPHHEKS